MHTSVHKNIFQSTIFRKTLIVLFLSLAVSTLIAWQWFRPRSTLDVRTEMAALIQERTDMLARYVNTRITESVLSPVMTLPLPPDLSEDALRRAGNAWLESHRTFASVAFWLKGKRLPVRVVRDSFWMEPDIQSLPASDRQHVFQFIINDTDRPAGNCELPVITRHMKTESGSESFINVCAPSHDQYELEAITAVSRFPDILGSHLLTELESLLITDENHDILVDIGPASGILHKAIPENHVYWADGWGFLKTSLDHDLWALMYAQRFYIVPPESVWTLEKRIFMIGTALIIMILSTIILALWIDRPLQRFLNAATDVGRGNFRKLIPPQEDDRLARLAQIFNYMAKEMHQMQKINVGEIISEKIKTETIIRYIADAVIVTDPANRVILVNQVAAQWFDLNEFKVRNEPVRKCIKNKQLIDLIEEVKNGKHHSTADLSLRVMSTNDEKMLQAHASRVQDQDRRMIGIVTVLRDVTKERQVDRLKTDLVSMVAHELKSPLTSIYGFSELLTELNLKNIQAREYAQVIQSESSRLTELVNKFLDLSKLEQGRTELHKAPMDLRQVVERQVRNLQPQAENKNIRISINIPETLSMAYGDPHLIEQVMLNLISNALKYSPYNAKVGIEITEQHHHFDINIIDNGYGIPKEDLPFIFDKFYRVSESESREEADGSGLGLALVKEIVERHGGTIQVNSKQGVGSVFSFTLTKVHTGQDQPEKEKNSILKNEQHNL